MSTVKIGRKRITIIKGLEYRETLQVKQAGVALDLSAVEFRGEVRHRNNSSVILADFEFATVAGDPYTRAAVITAAETSTLTVDDDNLSDNNVHNYDWLIKWPGGEWEMCREGHAVIRGRITKD